MKILTALAMMATSACAASTQQTIHAPPLERIEMETRSWGRLVAHWSIDASGEVRLTQPKPDVYNPTQYVTRREAAGTAGFREIRVLIGEAEAQGKQPLECTRVMTDSVYGDVQWVQPGGRSTKLSFYTACAEPGTQRIVAALNKADKKIANWAAGGEVVETSEVERN